MAFLKKPLNPLDELPPMRSINDLKSAFVVYAPTDPVAAAMLQQLETAETKHKNHIQPVLTDTERLLKERSNHPTPKLDLKTMQAGLRETSRMVEALLLKARQADLIAEIHREHAGVVAVGEALASAAAAVNPNAVPAMADKLKKALPSMAVLLESEVEMFKEAQKRVAQGGHPLFDETVSKVATEIWLIIDKGYDVLRGCVREARVEHDPVLESMPSIRSPLRPLYTGKDKAKTAAKKAAKGKGKPGRKSKIKTESVTPPAKTLTVTATPVPAPA